MAFGSFIVMDGCDGTGKSTLAKEIEKELRERFRKQVLATRCPGGSPLGEAIRTMMFTGDGTHAIDPDALRLLFSADELQFTKKILRPALAEGMTVLCDRYYPSHLVYMQQVGGNSDYVENMVLSMEKQIADLTMLFLVDPEEGARRCALRTDGKQAKKTWTDNVMAGKIRTGFVEYYQQKIKEGENICLIDTTGKSLVEVFNHVMVKVSEVVR